MDQKIKKFFNDQLYLINCIFKVTGAPIAILGIAIVAAVATPVAAAALKNLRLEGVLIPFNALSFFDINFPP